MGHFLPVFSHLKHQGSWLGTGFGREGNNYGMIAGSWREEAIKGWWPWLWQAVPDLRATGSSPRQSWHVAWQPIHALINSFLFPCHIHTRCIISNRIIWMYDWIAYFFFSLFHFVINKPCRHDPQLIHSNVDMQIQKFCLAAYTHTQWEDFPRVCEKSTTLVSPIPTEMDCKIRIGLLHGKKVIIIRDDPKWIENKYNLGRSPWFITLFFFWSSSTAFYVTKSDKFQ